MIKIEYQGCDSKNKYLVLNLDDIQKYNDEYEIICLESIINTIESGRYLKDNKSLSNNYLVVNKDKPYLFIKMVKIYFREISKVLRDKLIK